MFGENPQLPAAYCAGPSGLEEVDFSTAVAQNFRALHLAREAYIECENDHVLKMALKKRVYVDPKGLKPGTWIYFKNQKKWEGPVKITTMSGKLVYAIRKGQLLKINTDHIHVVKSGAIIRRELAKQQEPNPQPNGQGLHIQAGQEQDVQRGERELPGDPDQQEPEEIQVQPEQMEQVEIPEPEIEAEGNQEGIIEILPGPGPQGNIRGKACRTFMGPEAKDQWCKPCVSKKKCTEAPKRAQNQDQQIQNHENRGDIL